MPLPRISISLPLVAALVAGSSLHAQHVGGYAGAFLRRTALAQEVAMGGAFVPFASSASSVISNSAALARLERPTAILSNSFLRGGQEQLQLLGFGFGIGEMAGVGASIVKYGVGDVRSFTADGTERGSIASQELAFSIGGGLGIGPGSVGATIHYLRFSSGINEEDLAGYMVDLSGTLALETAFLKRDWVFMSVALNGIAGELRGPRDQVPLEMRLGGAYLYPLEERTTSARLDPSGHVITQRVRPRNYILGALELRQSQHDSTPTVSGALEWVPLGESPVPFGIRLGFDSRADIAFGFFLDVEPPADFADDLRLDFAARRDYDWGGLTSHITLTVGF